MSLPRFPVPFLEALLAYLPWQTVLNLVSVDKREAPVRHFLINQKGIVRGGQLETAAAELMFDKYPKLQLAQTEVMTLSDVHQRATTVSFHDRFSESMATFPG